MYNNRMKKISVLLILALLAGFSLQAPCQAGFLAEHKAKIEQKRTEKNTIQNIKKVLELQDKFANAHDIEKLKRLYSNDYINSDGFNFESSFKMIEETWATYPDISYSTQIKNIEISDNYATVLVEETAVATPKEKFGDFETIGELFSKSRCVYHLEKHGPIWQVSSEKVIDEVSTLKFGEARYINIELSTPKQIGAGKYYTTTLKVDAPQDVTMVGSINQKKLVFPPEETKEVFRKVTDNTLERVFKANTNNVNESVVASVGFTHAQNYDESKIRVYLSGLAFIMTRVDVIPENKYVKLEGKK